VNKTTADYLGGAVP